MEGKRSIIKKDYPQSKKMKPMLAKVGNKTDLDKKDYIYEPKLDGIRALLFKDRVIRLKSRNNQDLTKRFSHIDASTIKADSCILDGELVVYDTKGNPDFGIIKNSRDAVFVAFDMIEKEKKDLSEIPLLKRKQILDQTVEENSTLQKIFYTKKGKKLLDYMKQRDLEGVMAKKEDSLYESGRSDNWLKVKIINSIDCIIIGYTSQKRKISSLAVAIYNKGILTYIGKVGTGFNEQFIDEFKPKLKSLETGEKQEDIIKVRPKYIAEIEFMHLTKDNKLRSPVFKRLRFDKKAKECNLDQLK